MGQKLGVRDPYKCSKSDLNNNIMHPHVEFNAARDIFLHFWAYRVLSGPKNVQKCGCFTPYALIVAYSIEHKILNKKRASTQKNFKFHFFKFLYGLIIKNYCLITGGSHEG